MHLGKLKLPRTFCTTKFLVEIRMGVIKGVRIRVRVKLILHFFLLQKAKNQGRRATSRCQYNCFWNWKELHCTQHKKWYHSTNFQFISWLYQKQQEEYPDLLCPAVYDGMKAIEDLQTLPQKSKKKKTRKFIMKKWLEKWIDPTQAIVLLIRHSWHTIYVLVHKWHRKNSLLLIYFFHHFI